jgi:hypothetical protein
MMDDIPPFEQQLKQYGGPDTRDQFDITALYSASVNAFPNLPFFDVMIYLPGVEGQNISQGWSSREGATPPKLTVTIQNPDG